MARNFALTDPAIVRAFEKGLIETPTLLPSGRAAKPKKSDMVEELFASMPGGPVWVLPIVTASEANCRQWQAKSNRTREARRIVSPALGKRIDYLAPFARAYHAGIPVRVILTRLGGRKLDEGVNLPSSMKAVEDAVALMLGADDGSPLWHVEFEQEPEHTGHGVRIELRMKGKS